jgi:hypothetical protein
MKTIKMELDLDAIGKDRIDEIKRWIGVETYADFFNEAVTVLAWAAGQRRAGRIIATIDIMNNKDSYEELSMPALDYAAASAPPRFGEAGAGVGD